MAVRPHPHVASVEQLRRGGASLHAGSQDPVVLQVMGDGRRCRFHHVHQLVALLRPGEGEVAFVQQLKRH